MESSGPARGGDTARVRTAVRPRPLLTSRRHIDLLRVCSAASLPPAGGTAPARA
ncbi:hypothetical protein [Streptomyces sp. NPDC046862]|uniref:hypothetical protein n=1 Tax=Streptomyces sp. NPDC046862 TaxID=3154603 RepID=UPI00345426F6